jgi:hypothetical protein
VPSETVRFRGDSTASLARAVLEVITYARFTTDEFKFGPLDLNRMFRDGLLLSGPDLAGVTKLLDKLPGLVRSED